MERYSGSQTMEAVQVDPVGEWTAPGGETGLEEPMWQLEIGGGADLYPERPDEPNCVYYLRTGFCGFGYGCRFNHPRDRSMAMEALRAGGVQQYPERAGQPVCQYYMRTGMCKFGASCKYNHPRHGLGSSTPAALNIYGYPLRPGERECSYFIKTGQCKFGSTCKYNHPWGSQMAAPAPAPAPGPLAAPAAVYPPPPMQSPSIHSSQPYGVVPGNWAIPRPAMLPGSYVPMMLPPGVVPVPSWTTYPEYMVQAMANQVASPSTQPTVGAGPIYGMTQLSPSATVYPGPYLSITSSAGPSSSTQKEHAFPERPGQPDCQYYMRTGDCKFGPTCKYHHPQEWSAPKTYYSIGGVGLPLRPGAPLCSHYVQTGFCRFGPSCKFDHSQRGLISYSPSASSLSDMAVAPYPIGSTNATLAPSSSSSDLRPELLLSGFQNDAVMNTSSASVGSLFSQSVPVPQSSVQPGGQGSTSQGHGVDAQTSSS